MVCGLFIATINYKIYNMTNKILKAKVKKDGRVIEVYKLRDGRYNIFLGDKISLDKITKSEHTETFSADELEFI